MKLTSGGFSHSLFSQDVEMLIDTRGLGFAFVDIHPLTSLTKKLQLLIKFNVSTR